MYNESYMKQFFINSRHICKKMFLQRLHCKIIIRLNLQFVLRRVYTHLWNHKTLSFQYFLFLKKRKIYRMNYLVINSCNINHLLIKLFYKRCRYVAFNLWNRSTMDYTVINAFSKNIN